VSPAEDTIFALSSGAPPAAIAIVRVSGPAADDVAMAVAGAPLPQLRHATLRRFRTADGETIDRGLMLRFSAGGSVTGEPMVEFHVHGGRAVVARMLGLLADQPGLRLAGPGEFSRRALLGGRMSLFEAEALGDLLRAETEVERRAALSVHEGALGERLERWRAALIALSARAERAIDHADDDTLPVGEDARLARDIAALADEIGAVAARPTRDSLRDGVTVAIAGPPNAGKSSLLNALVGRDVALVSEIAGTTRDLIEVQLVLGGQRVRLVDTAGLREASDAVERMGVERARQSADAADLLVWLGDDTPPVRDYPTLAVQARCDLPGRGEGGTRLAVSSRTGEGLDALVEWIADLVRQLDPSSDTLVVNQRQADAMAAVASELRNAALQHDVVLSAEHLRLARRGLNGVTKPADLNAVMDRLFANFCLGK
jgi:tRNA modification GTPase